MRIKLCLLIIFLSVSTIFSEIRDISEVSLEADKIIYRDKNIIEADGNVIIYYKDMLLTADSVLYNKSNNNVSAYGNVTINDKDSYINADKISIDLDSKKGFIENGNGYYYPDKYFKASKMEKLGTNNYILDNATITGCEGENPDWSFTAGHAEIEYGEKFIAKNVRANIKGVPVLYLPYLAWPIKIKRESGFLIPDVGSSSDLGFIVTPKYFFNIDVDKDATLGVNVYSKKGAQILSEFRYAKSDKENIYIAGEFLHDYDSEANKDNRWKIVNKSNVFFNDQIELRFNTNYVSDFRYRRDFDDYSINQIEEYAENKYINEVRGNYYSKYADISMRYRDDMHFYDLEDGFMKEHLVRKPNFIIEKNYIDAKLLNIDYEFDYNNAKAVRRIYEIDAEDDESMTREFKRYHGSVKFYKPINVYFGTLTPSFRQFYTRWSDSNFGYGNVRESHRSDILKLDKHSDSIERLIYNIDVKLTLNDIYRDYGYLKHSIYNTFEFTDTPHLHQDELIKYLEDDVIDEENAYLYTLTNYLTSDNWHLRVDITNGLDASHNDRMVPFHEKINYGYKNFFTYNHEGKIDYYGDGITYFDNRINFNFNKFYINIRHLFDKELLEYSDDYILDRDFQYLPEELLFIRDIIGEENTQLNLTLGLNISRINIEFAMEASERHNDFGEKSFTDLDLNRFSIKSSYVSNCWEFGVKYKNDKYDDIEYDHIDRDTDHSILFFISLRGIGSGEKKFL
jgi:LPS-assembly protein